eukprot:gnl/TRDRNA2_/TRDRNA2_165670_c3_seq1.p1 gnl/TRDRNA2_/TRDRNA2_165670_c3~~gnl/TRDRNA2_/TRDRNA2_165670_c3_seq1.p1  ORF type:complete len:268 (+),score=31.25 gnl/TRDRNA2_/TRDRNA2_165670_c3_seq1:2-805(+)
MAMGAGEEPGPENYMALMTAYIWDELDVDVSGTLDMDEAREIFRLVISRPMTACVVRERVWQKLLSEGSNTWTRCDVLLAASSAAVKIAKDSKDETSKLWWYLDADQSKVITELEFRKGWSNALSNSVLESMTQITLQVLKDQSVAKETKAAKPMEAAAEAKGPEPPAISPLSLGAPFPATGSLNLGASLGGPFPSPLTSPRSMASPRSMDGSIADEHETESGKPRGNEVNVNSCYMAMCFGFRKSCDGNMMGGSKVTTERMTPASQ